MVAGNRSGARLSRSHPYRPSRWTGLVLGASLLVATGGCGSAMVMPPRSPTHRSDAGGHRGPGRIPLRSAPGPAVSLAPVPLRDLAVTMDEITVVDRSRDVVSGGRVLADRRTLPTYIWTPAGAGPFPLVVFVHGYDVGPLDFERFCAALAASGYVVAAPSFPLEDPSRGFGLDRGDLGNEAADVSLVISTLADREATDKVSPGRVAVVGHSDGADVALMTAYESGTVDPRVKAVVADAPDPVTTATVVPSSTPLLLVQGTADAIVPYAASQTVFGQIRSPVFYLSLLGAGHLAPIQGGTPWTPVLDSAVADFLDATVAGRGPAIGELPAELGSSPLVSVQTSG